MNAASGPAPADDGSAPPPGSATTRDLLEQVLQQTAVNALADPAGNQAVREALTEVAARYENQPLALEPVVVELIHATLATQFPLYQSQQRDWRAVSASIARILWDDPQSRERLGHLWEELGSQS